MAVDQDGQNININDADLPTTLLWAGLRRAFSYQVTTVFESVFPGNY